MDPILACVIFVAGLAFGSFLNVCISRIPRDQSIVTPRSHCLSCDAPIRWRDNIPVFSWILLRGRCRDCHARISFRYPVVELGTAILLLACYAHFGLTLPALKAATLCFLVLGLIFMDAETGLLPAEFTYSGIVLGLLFSLFAPVDSSGTSFLLRAFGKTPFAAPHWSSFFDALTAAAFGAAFLYLVWAMYYVVKKSSEGSGFGDIALAAMAGAFLGLKLTVLTVFLGYIIGLLYAITLFVRALSQKSSIRELRLHQAPFGVFLGIGALIALFFGEAIWSWYLGFFV